MVYPRPFEIGQRVVITSTAAALGIEAATPATVVGVFGRDTEWRVVVRTPDDVNGNQDFELAATAVTLAP